MDQKFFKILARGKFKPDQIDVEMVQAGSSLLRNPLSEAWMDGAWHEFVRQGNKPWPGDFIPKRYRLVEASENGERLKVTLDPCISYRDFIGAQVPEFATRFGSRAVPNALAISVVIQTADKQTLLTIREKRTDYKWHGWHGSIGGFMEILKQETPTQAGLRELKEEAGIEPTEVEELVCLGIVYNPWTAHPDLIYSAKTKLTAAEVLKRKHDDENQLLFVPTTAASYEHWIVGACHASVVVPLAALIWVGEEQFGKSWAEKMMGVLAEESKAYDLVEVRLKLEKRDIANFTKMVEDARAGKIAA